VQITAAGGEVIAVPLTVSAPAALAGRHALRFAVTPVDGGKPRDVESSFFGPAP
jgi:hypothetical protein